MRHRPTVGQRLARRRPNIGPTLAQCLVLAGKWFKKGEQNNL